MDPERVKKYNPRELPLRTHEEFLRQAREVDESGSNDLAKEYGVKGSPILIHLSSLSFPSSFPYEFMHLIWENLVPNLLDHWTGRFKTLDEGSEQYTLADAVWQAVGEASAEAGTTIPSAYGPRPFNVATQASHWTADSRSFWILYLGPVLLARRFQNEKYYRHFIDLVKILHTCLQFEYTLEDVESIRQGFINWVEKYEEYVALIHRVAHTILTMMHRYYYQRNPLRSSACPVTIHALLHVADSILAVGPVWASWAFPTERYCGKLQQAIASRRYPFMALDRFVSKEAALTHVMLKFNIEDELLFRSPARKQDISVAGCKWLLISVRSMLNLHTLDDTCVLQGRLPISFALLDNNLRNRVVDSLCLRYGCHIRAAMRAIINPSLCEWGVVRILDAGDTIRASSGPSKTIATDRRDTTFVRVRVFAIVSKTKVDSWCTLQYEFAQDANMNYRHRPEVLVASTHYGQLLRVLEVSLEPSLMTQSDVPTPILLAVIRECKVSRDHNDLDIHYYPVGARGEGPLDVLDLRSVQCLIGRVKDRGEWAIIDRSGTLARAIFHFEEEEEGDT